MGTFLEGFSRCRAQFVERFCEEPDALVMGASVLAEIVAAIHDHGIDLQTVGAECEGQVPVDLPCMFHGVACIQDGSISPGTSYFVGKGGRV